MGDRIAILREGGILAQYATPDELLTTPGRRVRRRASSAPTARSSACRSPRVADLELLAANGYDRNGEPDARPTTRRCATRCRSSSPTAARRCRWSRRTARSRGLVSTRADHRGPHGVNAALALAAQTVDPELRHGVGVRARTTASSARSWFSDNWGVDVLAGAARAHRPDACIAVVIGFVISFAPRAHRPPPRLGHGADHVRHRAPLHDPVAGAVPDPRARSRGLTRPTAEIALVSYTLLILFRNILTGLSEVPAEVREAARGHGPDRQRQILCGSSCRSRCRRSSPACGSPPSRSSPSPPSPRSSASTRASACRSSSRSSAGRSRPSWSAAACWPSCSRSSPTCCSSACQRLLTPWTQAARSTVA